MGQIPAALAEGLDVRLGQTVRQITTRSDGGTVVADREEFRSDYAVVTLPLGVLKADRVGFDPKLPAAVVTGRDRLRFGRFYKLIMTFERVFWDQRDFLGLVGSDIGGYGESDHSLFVNLDRAYGVPSLGLLAGGRFAVQLEEMGQESALSVATGRLALMYPEADVTVLDSRCTDWTASELTGGSYTYYGPDATLVDPLAFQSLVEGRLAFAGEHTSTHYPGTIHGAYLSGIGAARRLVGCS